jgi:hypothetical protein
MGILANRIDQLIGRKVIFFILLFNSLSGQAAGQLPNDWFRLPEDGAPSTLLLQKSPDPDPDLSSLLARTYQTNQETFEALPERSQPDSNRWHLGSFSTELGVTTSGLFGVLGMGGTANVSLRWTRQASSLPSLNSTAPLFSETSVNKTIGISEVDTTPALLRDLEPIIQIASAHGIKNQSLLRKNLLRAAQQFQELTRGIRNPPNSQWIATSFRFDFMIGASAQLLPIGIPASVGGDLRFGFEWSNRRGNSPSPSSFPASKIAQSLEKWLVSMQYCLASLTEDIPRFQTTGFSVGIGITGSGSIGLARGALSAMGSITFIPNPDRTHSLSTAPRELSSQDQTRSALSEMLIIENNPKPSHLEYARKNKIHFFESNSRHSSSLTQVAYRLRVPQFQKGLKKAVRIASFFAGPTKSLKHGKWHVSELYAGFSLSLGGDLGLVAIGSVATVSLSFRAI